MQLCDYGVNVLEELIEESSGNLLNLVDEHPNKGICYHCGELADGVEPDAAQYECEMCGKNAVHGLETALLRL